jgi:hypothetical protein
MKYKVLRDCYGFQGKYWKEGEEPDLDPKTNPPKHFKPLAGPKAPVEEPSPHAENPAETPAPDVEETAATPSQEETPKPAGPQKGKGGKGKK